MRLMIKKKRKERKASNLCTCFYLAKDQTSSKPSSSLSSSTIGRALFLAFVCSGSDPETRGEHFPPLKIQRCCAPPSYCPVHNRIWIHHGNTKSAISQPPPNRPLRYECFVPFARKQILFTKELTFSPLSSAHSIFREF